MAETIQRNFTAGEIAPALQSRTDMVKYMNGLALCDNFLIRPQGGVYSRPGQRFVGELGDSTKQGRLIPFSFNTLQTYILVFEDLKLRFVKDGGFVLKPAATITGATQANPVVISAVNTFVNGEKVTITGVVGMTELNGLTFTIANVTGTTFELAGIDGTLFTAYSSGGSAQSDGAFEIATPYTEAQLPRINFTQSADVMTIVHPSHDPRNLNRLADDDWTLTVNDYSPTVSPPTFSGATVKTITGVTQANPAVVTAVNHDFNTGNTIFIDNIVGMTELNGRSFKITPLTTDTFSLDGEDSTAHTVYVSGGDATRQNNATTIGTGFGDFQKTYTYVITTIDLNGIESIASLETSITTESLSVTGGVRLSWNAIAGASHYRIYKDPSTNTQRYGFIGNSNNTVFDDFNLAPIISDSPPTDRQPFSAVDDKPSAVNYYQQRQVFGNTTNEPQTVFTTQSDNYDSFRTSDPLRDDDAITFTVASRQVNEIRHILSLDALILLTSGGEWRVTEGQDQVLTPFTAGVKPQSYNGASFTVPVIIDDTVLYVQEKGKKVRELGYEFSSDKYGGNDLSIMSEHLFTDQNITEMSYASEPYGIVWCVRDDGVLLGLTYQRSHQVWGWHQHHTDGLYESTAVIDEDGRDAPYFIVNRTIGGGTKRYIERMEPRFTDDAKNSFFVDSGLSFSGAPATVISGLDHLEGEAVAVLSDGNEVKGLTVTSGSITLPRAASDVHVGLSYLPVIELLDIDIASATDTLKAKKVSVSKVTIEVQDSRGGFVGPRLDTGGTGQMLEIKPRFDSDGYDTIKLKTFKEEINIDPLWAKGGGIRIEQRSPLPMAILSVIPDVDVGG